jgi:thiol-disulfide isomerase/thioredoxin
MLVAACALAILPVVANLLFPHGADADPSRFIPWRGETPALALKDLDGRTQSLADYRGKVVLVNFWATWCEPCRDEMPSMRRLRERLARQPFEVLAVNYGESATRISEFLARERLDLTVLLDPNQEAARTWRVRVLPGSFLVGPEGRVRFSVIGEIDWATEDAVKTVRSLLPARGADGGRATERLAGTGAR